MGHRAAGRLDIYSGVGDGGERPVTTMIREGRDGAAEVRDGWSDPSAMGIDVKRARNPVIRSKVYIFCSA